MKFFDEIGYEIIFKQIGVLYCLLSLLIKLKFTDQFDIKSEEKMHSKFNSNDGYDYLKRKVLINLVKVALKS